MLIVPQTGVLDIQTEMGDMRIRPREICVVPRGIRFRVSLPHGPSRGHVIEAYSGHYDLPELGPIGSLGLANARDFEIPRAKYQDVDTVSEIIVKFSGKVHSTQMKGSAFNAVAWHGTYYPFKYDLGKFMPLGSTLYDHQVRPRLRDPLTVPPANANQLHRTLPYMWFSPAHQTNLTILQLISWFSVPAGW
jgi:homogentisate 1,2-dioxygenase